MTRTSLGDDRHGRRRGLAAWACCTALLALCSTRARAEAIAPELREVYVGKAGDEAFRLVVVAEGYTGADRSAFFADATVTVNGLLQGPPYAFVAPWLEVYGLFVESAQRGADRPGKGIQVSTAFDATFGAFNVDRLLTVDNGKVLSAVAAALPGFDVAIALVNDDKYGGSGGPVTVVSLNAASLDILRHELAHTLAKVADEYETPYPGYPPGDSEPNVTAAAHLSPLKWQAWVEGEVAIPTAISDATGPFTPIGAYEGARFQAKGMYRPAPTCIMRQLGVGFCPICLEAVLGAVAHEVFSVTAVAPQVTEGVVCGGNGCPLFGVAFPPHPSIVARWQLDGEEFGTGISVRPAPKTLGSHTVTATLDVETPLIRGPMRASLRQERSWTLNVIALPEVDAGPGPDVAMVDAQDAAEKDTAPTEPPTPAVDVGCGASPLRAGPRQPSSPHAAALMALLVALGWSMACRARATRPGRRQEMP